RARSTTRSSRASTRRAATSRRTRAASSGAGACGCASGRWSGATSHESPPRPGAGAEGVGRTLRRAARPRGRGLHGLPALRPPPLPARRRRQRGARARAGARAAPHPARGRAPRARARARAPRARRRPVPLPALQRAQPILLAHHLLAYHEMLARDRTRFRDCRARADELPLGAGALAGAGFPLDRRFVARQLGFARVTANSVDAVADRDAAVEFL